MVSCLSLSLPGLGWALILRRGHGHSRWPQPVPASALPPLAAVSQLSARPRPDPITHPSPRSRARPNHPPSQPKSAAVLLPLTPHLLSIMSGRRLYIGRVSQDATRKDLESHFGTHGPIVDVRLMGGFAFLEFEQLKVRTTRSDHHRSDNQSRI